MATNPISYDTYKQLLAAGQTYVRQQQAADPEWQTWQRLASATNVENAGELPPSPNKDYWAQYMGTLSPDQALGFQQHMRDSGGWQDKVGSVLKYAIPLAVGGAGLAGTGLFGTAAQAFVGGAPLGSLGTAAGGTALGASGIGDAAFADLAGGLLPEYGTEAAYTAGLGSSAGWAAAPSLGGVLNPGYAAAAGGLGALGTAAKDAAGSLLSGGATGGGGSGSAFRNTLTGKVSDTQETLNDRLAGSMDNQLAFNREQFDYYKGLSDRNYQLGQDTFNWNRGLADDAKARAARYDQLYFNTTGRQLQQFSNDVDAYNAPAEGLRMSGRAMADVEGQLDNARGAYQRGMTSRGWNPNSAAMQSSMGDMELQGALAKASASTMAYEAAKREGLNMRAMAAGLGQANSNVATANTGLSGQLNTSGMESANQSMTPGFTNLGLYNAGQGTAVNWGNAANSGFNAMRTGNSSWSDNMNYAGAIRGGLSGYANNGWLGGLAGAAGGLLSGG